MISANSNFVNELNAFYACKRAKETGIEDEAAEEEEDRLNQWFHSVQIDIEDAAKIRARRPYTGLRRPELYELAVRGDEKIHRREIWQSRLPSGRRRMIIYETVYCNSFE